MPYIDVKLFEGRLNEHTETRLLAALTDAVVSVFGEDVRPATWVVLEEVPRSRWGIGTPALHARADHEEGSAA